jgi:hypothetical protein
MNDEDELDDGYEDIEEGDIVFEADEALILALNGIHDLKELVDEQRSSILDLKEELILLKKQIRK